MGARGWRWVSVHSAAAHSLGRRTRACSTGWPTHPGRHTTNQAKPTVTKPSAATGIAALDHVLGGRVPHTSLTLIESDPIAQANELLSGIASDCRARCLLTTDDVTDTATWLLAGVTEIMRVALTDAYTNGPGSPGASTAGVAKTVAFA